MPPRTFYVYVLTNSTCTTLYVGVTNDLRRRLSEHREGLGSAFTRKYQTHRLVYLETHTKALEAIEREKALKRAPRRRKKRIIEEQNPDWRELSEDLW